MPRQIDVGSVLNSRYELLALIGRGGMGLVFKARDRILGEPVALKVLLPGSDLSPEVLARFREEVRLARSVRHRNVCAIHSYEEDGDIPFIVMELVEGIELKRALVKVHAVEWEDGFDVALQVASGLTAIHERGIVHRDLKPANITRDAEGIVRIMDFGIAKGETQPGFTDDGRLVCTIDYVSPEQILGASVDPRSDLYSFGIVIYELFTGRVPFRGDTPAATMHKHVHEAPPLHGLAASLIPESLVPVLEVALAKEPGVRFRTVGEMHDALVRAREEMRKRGTSPVVAGNGSAQESRPRHALSGPYPPEALLLVPALVRALASVDRGVRVGAAEALARTPHASARGALEVAIDDEDRDVRERAKDALRRLARPLAPVEDQRAVRPSADPDSAGPTSDIDPSVVVKPEPSDADAPRGPDPPSDSIPPPDGHPPLVARDRESGPTPPLAPPRPTIPRWLFWLVGLWKRR